MMLVLSRKLNERIIIDLGSGEKIVVCLVAIAGDKARIGIEAPEEIPVHRHEVYEAIHGKKDTA